MIDTGGPSTHPTVSEFYRAKLMAGAMSVNEVRAREGLAPLGTANTEDCRWPHGWWILPGAVLGAATWGLAIYGAIHLFGHGIAS